MSALLILLFILFALHDYAVIKSYNTKYYKEYKRYWHGLKLAIVILTGILICGINLLLVAYLLGYYVIFESVLNIARGLPLFYVSKDGSVTDKIRFGLFGKYSKVAEGCIKLICVITIIIIIYEKIKQNNGNAIWEFY